jgi:hypothetical protein
LYVLEFPENPRKVGPQWIFGFFGSKSDFYAGKICLFFGKFSEFG